jgi:hypothetical protein
MIDYFFLYNNKTTMLIYEFQFLFLILQNENFKLQSIAEKRKTISTKILLLELKL